MRASCLAVFAAALLLTSEAHAFVCSRVSGSDGREGPSLSWFTRQVSWAYFQGGTGDISTNGEQQALRESFQVWANLTTGSDSTCTGGVDTDVAFFEEAGDASTDRIGYDFANPGANQNLMIFRDSGWPHGSKIIALTTTTYSPLTGEILDADIEFNTQGFEFSVGDVAVSTDLKNTAVHEIGHLLGLAHTGVRNATMFAEAGEGEVKKRDLACDDRDATVFKYPANEDNGYCDPPETTCGGCAPPGDLSRRPSVVVGDYSPTGEMGGCAAASGAPWWALAGAALLALARRAHARRSPR